MSVGAKDCDTSRIVLVTGLSGAGRTTCLKSLEDHGFEAVDNLPLSLLPALLAPSRDGDATGQHDIAVGVDIRTRDFDVGVFMRQLALLRARGDIRLTLVFLECDDEALLQRFTETRRRHPMAIDRPVADGIRAERALMWSIRETADSVIDSSGLSLGRFREILTGELGIRDDDRMTVSITSFGFRNGLPREADMVFDVRFLTNPHYDLNLRPLDGRAPEIATYVSDDPNFQPFFTRLVNFIEPLIALYSGEGKSYLTIAVGCTGGRHRSVFVADTLASRLKAADHPVNLVHRDLNRISAAPEVIVLEETVLEETALAGQQQDNGAVE
jgi:UPF0042 nucleotide-binding protein